MLKLDVSTIVLTLINLLVLYLLLKKFLISPVLSIMKQRESMIEDKFQDAEQAKVQADGLAQQYEEKVRTAREESVQILEKARMEAAVEYEAKIREAEEQSKQILGNARDQVEVERAQAVRALKSEIAGLALQAAGKILSQAQDQTQDQVMYHEFLVRAGDDNDTDSQ